MNDYVLNEECKKLLDEICCKNEYLDLLSPMREKHSKDELLAFALFRYTEHLDHSIQYWLDYDPYYGDFLLRLENLSEEEIDLLYSDDYGKKSVKEVNENG